MKKYQYNDYMTSYTSTTSRYNKGTFEANSRLTNKIWNLLGAIDLKAMEALMEKGEYLDVWKFIEENIFSMK